MVGVFKASICSCDNGMSPESVDTIEIEPTLEGVFPSGVLVPAQSESRRLAANACWAACVKMADQRLSSFLAASRL